MTASRIIYASQHYTACAMRDGSLVVTRTTKKPSMRKGVHIVSEQAAEWIAAIEESAAIDKTEAGQLCRVLFNQ